jgi:hypothetical protein
MAIEWTQYRPGKTTGESTYLPLLFVGNRDIQTLVLHIIDDPFQPSNK